MRHSIGKVEVDAIPIVLERVHDALYLAMRELQREGELGAEAKAVLARVVEDSVLDVRRVMETLNGPEPE